MNSPVRIKALVLKEFRQVLRDPSSILIAFVLPAILLMLFGYGINMDAKNIPIGVALESSAPEAGRLLQSFLATTYFKVTVARDARVLQADVTAGRLRGLVIIPSDFSQKLLSGRETPILVVTDGSETNTANFVRNYAAGVLECWRRGEVLEHGGAAFPPIDMEERFWYNPELISRNALVPGSLAIVMACVGALLTSLVVAREWERGTMEALLSTPVTPVEMLIGKTVPYFTLGICSLAASVAVSIFVFKVPFRGGLLGLMLAGGAFLLCSLGQGLLISTLAKNQFVASQAALVSAFLPAFLLSGFIFEIASMPWVIRQITRIVPARYLVANFQTLFLAGDVWAVLIPNILFLLIITVFFFGVTLVKTPIRLESP